jgi:D-beta-D-heptose 7-phosphate kinase/D-beta-D-heptose 1-phosphate adenosyltransferase
VTAGRGPSLRKLVDLDPLLSTLEPARARGATIVFTNGCYDLLHVGHLRLLESAAALGDVLVVGINRDASVGRLKGRHRPYVPFEERASLLAALESVDWVIGFDEDTPEALVRAIGPDVLVKGVDWSLEQVAGRETVEARGGRVVRIPLVPGRSTTTLVERVAGPPRDRSA